jgi:hypothetical protein
MVTSAQPVAEPLGDQEVDLFRGSEHTIDQRWPDRGVAICDVHHHARQRGGQWERGWSIAVQPRDTKDAGDFIRRKAGG